MKKSLLILLTLLLPISLAAGKAKDISILTGSPGGNYYKAAEELQKVLGGRYKFSIKKSPGSFVNIRKLGKGQGDLAIAQFDVIMLYLSMSKSDRLLVSNCQVLAPLNLENIHIVVRNGAGIKSFQDLKNKKVAVGPAKSGSWVSAYILMWELNRYTIRNKSNILNMPYKQAVRKLAAGEIDALFFTSQAGVPLLKNLPTAHRDKISLLSFGKRFRLSRELRKYYSVNRIAAGTYPWQKKDVYTLATRSYLLVYKKLSQNRVYTIAGSIYGKALQLRKTSNLWKHLSRENAKKGIKSNLPYHAGVKKYILGR